MYKYLKRTFDIILSLIFFLLISPFFLLIILLQFIFNGLPIFYKGVRTGKDNRIFRIIKFRTMVKDAEKKGGFTTSKNDTRITKFGSLLRKTKLDEFPQLINIFMGDMSFIGPRPEVPYYTNKYTELEKLILSVRPGITDFSSIKFISLDDEVGSENADKVYQEKILKEKNRLRLKYINEMSLYTDTKIFFITLYKVFIRIISYDKINKNDKRNDLP